LPRRGTELKSPYFPRERGERLIATARLLIAIAAAAAVGLEGQTVERWTQWPIVIGFSLYAALLAIVVEFGALPDAKTAFAMHALDLAYFAALVRGTDGPPFFVCFTFALLAAASRWDWRGVLWTGAAAVALSALLGIGAQSGRALFVRVIYTSVVASMIAMLGIEEERRRHELKRLSSWRVAHASDRAALLADTLHFAAEVLAAPRVLVAWEDTEEPWLNLVFLDGAGIHETRDSPGGVASLVASGLAEAAFACAGLNPLATTLTDSGGSLHRWKGAPIDARLALRYEMRSVVSAPFSYDSLEGRIFALDGRNVTSDDLVLARAAGFGVAAGIQNIARWRQVESEAAARERLRFSRELHDGVLQFLAGTALQIESVRQLLDGRAPQTASERLDQIGEWIQAEQRMLRFFVGELRPGSGLGGDDAPGEGLRRFAERVGRHWEIEVAFEAAALPLLRKGLFEEIARLIQEAIVNAARHAGASRVAVASAPAGPTIRITVEDNGHGFSFSGRWDLEALNRERLGPVSLKERVSALGGSLTIASQDAGSRIDMVVPREVPEGDDA
jgi:signal transduction histidine kinase